MTAKTLHDGRTINGTTKNPRASSKQAPGTLREPRHPIVNGSSSLKETTLDEDDMKTNYEEVALDAVPGDLCSVREADPLKQGLKHITQIIG